MELTCVVHVSTIDAP